MSFPHCQVVIPNIIMRNDNGKAQLTVRNVNELLNSMDLDVVGNRNIGAGLSMNILHVGDKSPVQES